MSPDQHRITGSESDRQNRRANLIRLLMPVLVVIIAAATAFWMLQTGPKAKPRSKTRNAVLVEIRPIELGPQTTTISVMGTVIPKREVALKPQVSGTVMETNDKLIPGGRFKEGERLLTIDPRDYQLAVKQLATEVARAEADMQMELGRQRVAQREYQLLGETVSPEELTLMLRTPQLESTQALLDGARARLEQARLDLSRTTITAPYNAVVTSREVNTGAQVSPTTTLATLIDSDSYWVEASIPTYQLKWVNSGLQGDHSGSSVRIYDSSAWGPDNFRSGRLIGLTATIEENGRMAKLLAEIKDPLSLEPSSAGLPKLLLGSYVKVEIEGKTLPQAAAIDRNLVHDGERLWIMDEQGHLDIRPVEISFRGQDQVLVTAGIRAGEQLITTNLPSPVQGMTLRLKEPEPAAPAEGEKPRP